MGDALAHGLPRAPGPGVRFSAAELVALGAFLGERGLCSGPVTATPIGDGHSNRTDLVTDGAVRLVVRRPPPPPVPPGAHDVLREARLVAALAGSGVPVPAVLATAAAGEVGDSPLAVTSHVAGPVVTTVTPPSLVGQGQGQGRAVGEALVDVLAALHAVDVSAPALAGLGRPEGFNARHLRRVRGLVEDPRLDDLHAWLAERVPAESGAAVVHGDYRLGNVILGDGPPGRVAAVLDWELATLGVTPCSTSPTCSPRGRNRARRRPPSPHSGRRRRSRAGPAVATPPPATPTRAGATCRGCAGSPCWCSGSSACSTSTAAGAARIPTTGAPVRWTRSSPRRARPATAEPGQDGAERLDLGQSDGVGWPVPRDPEGNEFCPPAPRSSWSPVSGDRGRLVGTAVGHAGTRVQPRGRPRDDDAAPRTRSAVRER